MINDNCPVCGSFIWSDICSVCGVITGGPAPETDACANFHYPKSTEKVPNKTLIGISPLEALTKLKHIIEYLEVREQVALDVLNNTMLFLSSHDAKSTVYAMIEKLEQEIYNTSESRQRYYKSESKQF